MKSAWCKWSELYWESHDDKVKHYAHYSVTDTHITQYRNVVNVVNQTGPARLALQSSYQEQQHFVFNNIVHTQTVIIPIHSLSLSYSFKRNTMSASTNESISDSSESVSDAECSKSRDDTGRRLLSSTSGGPSQVIKDYVTYLNNLRHSDNSHNGSKLLYRELVNYVASRFYRCSTTVKVRILMSLLYVPPTLIVECKEVLSALLLDCETESDDWVRKLARLLQPYVTTGGHLDIRLVDTEVAYQVLKFLDEQKKAENIQTPYRLKRAQEYSRLFDAAEDPWPPDPEVTRRIQSNITKPNRQQQVFNPGGGGKTTAVAPSVAGYVATLPHFEGEVRHFRPTGDFSVFMRDIEGQGFAAIARELRNVEHLRQQQERVARGSMYS